MQQQAALALNATMLHALRQKALARAPLTLASNRIEFGWSELAQGRVRWVDSIDHEGRSVLILAPCRQDSELHALTAIEERIARRAGLAQSNKQIGTAVRLSETAVENHLSRALRKLGLRDRVALARLYTQLEAAGRV
jgi:DNA-binding NarL/FixJ family response regulator